MFFALTSRANFDGFFSDNILITIIPGSAFCYHYFIRDPAAVWVALDVLAHDAEALGSAGFVCGVRLKGRIPPFTYLQLFAALAPGEVSAE